VKVQTLLLFRVAQEHGTMMHPLPLNVRDAVWVATAQVEMLRNRIVPLVSGTMMLLQPHHALHVHPVTTALEVPVAALHALWGSKIMIKIPQHNALSAKVAHSARVLPQRSKFAHLDHGTTILLQQRPVSCAVVGTFVQAVQIY
jgi:hypothetical protein